MALLIIAWGIAMFNLGRIVVTQPIDWFGLVISAFCLVAIPVIGVAAAREAR